MQVRLGSPTIRVPGALDALQKLGASATTAGIPETTRYMIHLRASQINGCSVCVGLHSRELEHELLVAIATINAYNRLSVPTRQITGEWVDPIAQACAHAA